VGQQLALSREASESSLLAALKALEIQRTLGTEPVLTALRHFPAQPAKYAEIETVYNAEIAARDTAARASRALTQAPGCLTRNRLPASTTSRVDRHSIERLNRP